MIGEVVRKRGDRGSGGGAEAFEPGVAYICSKATLIAVMNLISDDWHHAGPDMVRTAALSTRVERPYYHLILTWHPDEQPTAEEQLAAMCDMIEALGLGEHQAVIGTHDDKEHCHIHAAFNTVHPLTGKVWSKSNDHLRIEKACRAIELKYGWRHDNGRFDFDVTGDGEAKEVHLRPAPARWAEKQARRAAGLNKPSRTDIAFEKEFGLKSFGQSIPDALRDRFGEIATHAQCWSDFHANLAEIGLRYVQKGSGAVVELIGSDEKAKASAFGQAFSFSRMEKRFGRYREPTDAAEAGPAPREYTENRIDGITRAGDPALFVPKVEAFKLTLLRRIYTELYLDPQVAAQIKYVNLALEHPRILLKSGTDITDRGSQIVTTMADIDAIRLMVAMAKAKGWPAAIPTGSEEFITEFSIIAAQEGLPVSDVPPEVQVIADQVLAERQAAAPDAAKGNANLASEDEGSTAPAPSPIEAVENKNAPLNQGPTSHAKLAADTILGTDETEIPSPTLETSPPADMDAATDKSLEPDNTEHGAAPEKDDFPEM